MAMYAVWTTFNKTNDEERLRIRPKHRQYLDARLDDGSLIASGPFGDESGALFVYQADSEDAVRQLLANDPYSSVGALGSIEIKEWKRLYTQANEQAKPAPIG